MCIITGKVTSVTSTRIFVAPSLDGKRQLTAYLNTVESPATNLMILPVPFPASVKFETKMMRSYKDLFRDLELSFDTVSTGNGPPAPWATRGRGGGGAASAPLEVKKVGSYLASVAPTAADLERLDATAFPALAGQPLPAALREMLASTYDASFGFICCQLEAGKTTYEPILYSHDAQKGGTSKRPKLFVPTKHFHGEHSATATKEHWDHVIYSIGTNPHEAHTTHADSLYAHIPLQFIPKLPNSVRWNLAPAPFQLGCDRPIHRWWMRGLWDNSDLHFQVYPTPGPLPPSLEHATPRLEAALPGLRGIWR